MGKSEDSLIEYCSQGRRFAELANGWLFNGREYLKAEDLTDIDRRQEYKGGHVQKLRHRYRDIFKETKNMSIRLLVGIELQENVDYMMTLRVMDMNILSYFRQTKKISAAHVVQKDWESGAEFLSKFKKEDRLLPVITLVLYLGKEPWDAAKSLHELLEFRGFPEEAKKYVDNYRLHVLDVRHTPDEELEHFPDDIRFLFLFIKYTEDKKALEAILKRFGQEEVAEDTFEALACYIDEPKLLEKKWKYKKEGEEKNMGCKAIREMVEDGRTEGQERVNRLNLCLAQMGRTEDIVKAAQDSEYQKQLFAEFNL